MFVAPAVTAPIEEDEGLSLRLVDIVLTLSGTFVTAYLVLAGHWVPGWWAAALVYALIAAGPPILRGLARKYPRSSLLDIAASFWLLPSVIAGHCFLGAMTDAVRPSLMDGYLAFADERLLGFQPALVLEPYVRGWPTEVMLVCYYTYYLWPVLLGAVLYQQKDRSTFDQYLLALSLFFVTNFALYVLVPAVGPRFFMADRFQAPLQGIWITSFLDGVMRQTAFYRDCFPSGHTGATLMVLAFAYLHARRLFWIVLPFALGLISATLVGRFHYGVDLIAAVPLMLGTMNAAGWLTRVRPHGVQMGTGWFIASAGAKGVSSL